eukprot:m.922896 g.922896  ORF g.922896 m.922896 type:complete len:303 (+) comp103972_c0_seq1:310-1218(+)
MYTSGSTGKPKGVAISRNSVRHLLQSMQEAVGLTSSDTFLAITTITFDISVAELLLPLISSSRLVILTSDQSADPFRLASAIESYNPTVMQGTPATWQALLTTGWTGSRHLMALCGGDKIRPQLASDLLAACRALLLFYGPTEATVWVSCCSFAPSAEVTIGKPMAHACFHVLDATTREIRESEGQLWISGPALALGYWRNGQLDEELRRQSFQFVQLGADIPIRAYATGDLVRRVMDRDSLCYVGRLDSQVKVNGFRIELGEIELVLLEHRAVREVVAAVSETSRGFRQLVGGICQTKRDS